MAAVSVLDSLRRRNPSGTIAGASPALPKDAKLWFRKAWRCTASHGPDVDERLLASKAVAVIGYLLSH